MEKDKEQKPIDDNSSLDSKIENDIVENQPDLNSNTEKKEEEGRGGMRVSAIFRMFS